VVNAEQAPAKEAAPAAPAAAPAVKQPEKKANEPVKAVKDAEVMDIRSSARKS
jgi:hypothetical protein